MGRQKADGRGRLGGRVKGVPNKSTKEMRDTISKFVEENFDEFTKSWKTIKPPDKQCAVYIDLLKYAIPALSSIGIGMDEETKEKMSDYLSNLRDSVKKEEI